MAELPKSYLGAQVIESGKPLQINEIQIPELQQGEVLIRVEAAPIDQLDLVSAGAENYLNKQVPFVLGAEGSGIIVAKHESVQNLEIGQKASFLTLSKFGAYGQYSVANISFVLPLPENLSFEQGASAIGNPVTVMLMLEEAKEQKAKAVINTAAASALGRQFVRYFQSNGIEVINIIRRKEQENTLKQDGAKYILNSSDPNFLKDLEQLITELKVTLFFDAIGGEITGKIFKLLPSGSITYIYGMLSGTNFEIDGKEILTRGKIIKNFSLLSTKHPFNPFSHQEALSRLHELLQSQLQTHYHKQYSLNQINEALEDQKQNGSIGKVLIRPNK
ncbi:unnamed protein product [Paramecium pentaurelia]|uniref:Enoyl reductase (ER) domain-containing protein n=1 Tax=Paramecium pentaurelia TaxID=43138 RepID=A0A8S1VC19_9CILI|nr:unnamed protein product [Paramecium pentaurelia]